MLELVELSDPHFRSLLPPPPTSDLFRLRNHKHIPARVASAAPATPPTTPATILVTLVFDAAEEALGDAVDEPCDGAPVKQLTFVPFEMKNGAESLLTVGVESARPCISYQPCVRLTEGHVQDDADVFVSTSCCWIVVLMLCLASMRNKAL